MRTKSHTLDDTTQLSWPIQNYKMRYRRDFSLFIVTNYYANIVDRRRKTMKETLW